MVHGAECSYKGKPPKMGMEGGFIKMAKKVVAKKAVKKVAKKKGY